MKINKSENFDLTNPQKSIWLTEQFYKGTSVNNICGTLLIKEKVHFEKLKLAVKYAFRDNDALRTRLTIGADNEIKQYLYPFMEEEWDHLLFITPLIDFTFDDELNSLEHSMASNVFSTIDSPLFSFKFYRFPDGNGGFVITLHHLISDAFSIGLLASKIINIYHSLLIGDYITEPASSYLDYIQSEKDYLCSEKCLKDAQYWENKFQIVPEFGIIPSTTANSVDSCVASRKNFIVSAEEMSSIHVFCTKHKISIFNFFMGIYAIYMGKVSNLSEFVVGTPILNRSNYLEKNTLGMFVSTIPFKFSIEKNLRFLDFIKDIAMDSMGMLRHQKYPYQNILEHIRTKNPNQPNLYDILISYQVTKTNRNSVTIPYEVKWNFNECVADSMQIHLYDINDRGILSITYDYKTCKYSEEEISSLHQRILFIIEQVLKDSSICLSDVSIVTPVEEKTLLHFFNNTALEIPFSDSIVSIFEEQVSKTPENIAMVFKEKTLTYAELNCYINRLAHTLREDYAITSNSIVAVLVERSLETMIAILAVLKAGGAYIPIDPEYPLERISYVLENSNASIILSKQEQSEKLSMLAFKGTILYCDLPTKESKNSCYCDNFKNLSFLSQPEDLCYIIYTSGSTGKPKGVMLTHKNMTNFIHSMRNSISYLNDGVYHSIVSITTISFDIFAFETLISLCHGLKLFMTDEAEQKITGKLERLLIDNHIEIIQSTPSIMNFHLENTTLNGFSGVSYVMLAGEQLPKKLVDNLKEVNPSITVYNGYGPSETTIFSTVKNVTHSDFITIGKPIHNTQIYILNKDLELLPPDTMGEIYIAGYGVGNGYLNREDLTSASYLPNPFYEEEKQNAIMYKTGDLGIWLSNGEIECKGRVDNQIKLRGLRIELGEIEECINSFISDANIKSAVIIKNVEDKVSLNAFISSAIPLELKDLTRHLVCYLPSYMIPNTYTFLDALPFTPNGKIDRKALVYYEISQNSEKDLTSYVSPRNEIEKILVSSISKKLGLQDFGIDNNIFDYGADSLTIINILTDLFQYRLPLKVYDLYKYPTIRALYDNLLTDNEIQKNLDIARFEELNCVVKRFSCGTSVERLDTKKQYVFLTGSTGFLGAHLLANLLDKNIAHIEKIYCAIRKKDDNSILERLQERMHFYFGTKYDALIATFVEPVLVDVTSDSSTYELPHKPDMVIHCAANVKHYGNYTDFEKVNIEGTKNIIAYCNKFSIPLHYISTMTISGNYLLEQQKDNIVFSENSLFEGQSFDDSVYSKSKLIAESFVIEAIKNGAIATIYRIGDLTGRFSDGVFQKNIEDNSIYLRLRSIMEIGMIPNSILSTTLEFSPVDSASEAICKIIWSTDNRNRIFHIYNPHYLDLLELLKYLKNLSVPIKVLPKEDFMHLIEYLSSNEENQSKLSGIINDFTKDDDLIYTHIMPTDNKITCAYLSKLGFYWPTLDIVYIQKILDYMKQVNFLKF